MMPLFGDGCDLYEISNLRDDRALLFQRLDWMAQNNAPMIGFNNCGYDYVLLHLLLTNPSATYSDLYAKSQAIIGSGFGESRWAHTIWPRDRLLIQIDLMLLHHFDNRAKSTSLKALQFAMRSESVVESSLPFDRAVTAEEIEQELIPYNKHDVLETKQFAHHSLDAIKFRLGLVEQFGVECLSWNDTKIGEKMLEQRLGPDTCYDWSSGRKQRRQTIRTRIALRDIIFPYIQFNNPEFQRVHEFMQNQVLTPADMDDPDSPIQTKGVINVTADVGGLEFHFGTGGMHACLPPQVLRGDENWMIRDIDVASLYPSLSNVNQLAPEHLGGRYVAEYAKLPIERKQHAKGSPLNALFKLAGNGAWGKSGNMYSFLYDLNYFLSMPINGQLLICMLAEWLLVVPTIRLIAVNTDGITYYIHRDYLAQAQQIEQQWEAYTCLVLEDAEYDALWLADVNSYVARYTDGTLKQKGRYWHPDALDYHGSIGGASPPAWHKDHSNLISTRAAVMSMVHGIDVETIIRGHTDPYDFMLRAKVNRSDALYIGDKEQQRVTRYYISTRGEQMVKVAPPVAGGVIGQYKRANGVTKAEYERIMSDNGWEWHPDVCTKNKSKYTERRTTIQSGWKVRECNDASSFDWSDVDYAYYVAEARKLLIT